jgi:hypothetical protein
MVAARDPGGRYDAWICVFGMKTVEIHENA